MARRRCVRIAGRGDRRLTWIKVARPRSLFIDVRQLRSRPTCDDDAMQQGLPMRALTAMRPFRDRKLLEGVIARLPTFRHLSRDDLEAVVGYSQLREFRRGATIAKRGEASPGVIALVEGSAKL